MQYLVWPNLNDKHKNLLDGGQAFYNCYECADGKFMALGAIEPKFFEEFISNLNKATLSNANFAQFKISQINQFDADLKDKLDKIFKLKTRDEWTSVFLNTDACCTPILEPEEVHSFEYFKKRKSFLDQFTPNVSPRFLTTGDNNLDNQDDNSSINLIDVLNKLKVDADQLNSLVKDGIIQIDKSKL